MRVEFHPQTDTDLNDAISYYNEHRPGLGDALRAEAYAAIDRILLKPKQYTVVEHDIRRCFLHRFPYSVLFRTVSDDLVRILVIRHHRRHPDFGLKRP
jgi:plasmid stabilization system protein ParE